MYAAYTSSSQSDTILNTKLSACSGPAAHVLTVCRATQWSLCVRKIQNILQEKKSVICLLSYFFN